MLKKSCLAALAVAMLSSVPSFAQDEINNNQPVSGPLNKTEARIQSKLTADYHKGLINDDQLSAMQRDFDGILEKENQLQTGGGMNESGKKTVLKMLADFEARLDKAAGINADAGGAKTKKKGK